MLSLYGRQWESSYGQIDGDVFVAWGESLATLSVDQIKLGLDSVIAEGNEFPPNLIKFMRMCKVVQHASHQTYTPALAKPKPRYSVVRIERAKQKALTGEAFSLTQPADRYTMDWNGDDEAELCGLIEGWNEATGHQGLNKLIDGHEFSHGTHYVNSGINAYDIIAVNLSEGRVQYKDTKRMDWMPEGLSV